MITMALVLVAFPYPVDLLGNILGAFRKLRKATIFIKSVHPYVCGHPSAWNNLAPTIQLFIKFDISEFLNKICP
jgi:hypothetical protein